MVILLPVLAPIAAVQAIAGKDGKERQRAAAVRRAAAGLPAGKDVGQWLYLAACGIIPGIAVAAWYVIRAVRLPPHGTAGLWVALLLSAAFGIQNIVTLYMLAFRFSRNSGHTTRQVRYGEIQNEINNCPTTKILLAGYSQGAQVSADAYQELTATQKSHIFGMFLLADARFNSTDTSGADQGSYVPGNNGAVKAPGVANPRPVFTSSDNGTVLSYCATGDWVCQGAFSKTGTSGLSRVNAAAGIGIHTNYSVASSKYYTQNACGQSYPQAAATYFLTKAGVSHPSSSGPVAVLTPTEDALTGDPVTISAGASCDPEGEALTFAWQIDAATVSGTTGAVTTTFSTAGSHTVSVTVTNAQGQTSTASGTITVSGPGSYTGPPSAPPGNVASAPSFGGATLTWSAPASGPPAEGYEVLTTDGEPVAAVDTDTGDANSITIPAGDLPMTVVVVPVNRVGEGPPSAPVTMAALEAVPDTNLNTMWNDYGNQGGATQWTGGDGTMSVPLPDGRIAWFFSDTFLGTVNPDGSRPADSPLVHNSAVIQTGQPGNTATLQTLIGGTASYPTALVPDSGQGNAAGYEAHAGWVNGNTVQVFYIHYASTGPGALDRVPDATAVATFSLPNLTLQSVTTLPLTPTILWGESVITVSGYTYVYGNGKSGMYVARAPQGEVVDTSGSSPTDQWQFWTGSGWSSSESAAVSILTGVAGLSVEQVNGQYVLVSFDSATPFGGNIVAYTATAPTGPFTGKTYLYQTPPPSLPGGATCACLTYLAQQHPEFASSGELVISYDTDTLDPTENSKYVAIYRPRFIDVNWPVSTAPGSILPQPPSNLTATSGSGGITLNWTASPTPGVSYWVYGQNTTTGETYPSRLLSTTSTSALLSSLTNGDSYRFTVTAYDTAGESPPSNSVTATPAVAAPAAAPTGLTATANSDGSVTLTWQPVSGAQWYDIQDEDVSDGATSYSPTAYSPAGTTVTVTGLTVGDEYSFEVAGVNAGGTGPYSQPATATVFMTPPTAPASLTGTANADGTITLNWHVPTTGCPCWYNVYSSTDGGTTWSGPFLSTTNTWTGTYLTIGATYTFYVEATNSGGASPPSNQVTETAQMTAPSAPAGLTGTADTTTGNIDLTWNVPSSGCTYGCWYNVYESADGGATWSGPFLSTTNSWTGTYLNVGTTYTFYVEATNAGGASPPSNQVSVMSAMAPPTAPTGLTGKADTSTGNIDLTWNVPASGCPTGCWYDVYVSTDGGSTWGGPYLSTTNSWTDTYLNAGTTYTYYVAATNSGGVSPPSNQVSVTSAVAPPSAPTGLTATADTTTGNIDLAWNVPASGCSNGCWYNVYVSTDGGSTWSAPYLTKTNSWTDTYLTVGTTYTYYVEATNAGGASPPSSQVSVKSAMTPPTAPTGLSGTADSNGDITLSWTAPASGCPTGCWYNVYSSTNGGSTWSGPYLSETTSWTATSLTVGTTYTYYVEATNSGGASPPSNQVSVTSYVPPAAAPTNLVATPGDGHVSLTWSAPPGCGSCDYYVYYRDTATSSSYTSYLDTTTSADVTFLNNGDKYAFYVTSDDGTQSGPSATVYATPEPPPPSAPTGLALTSNNDGTISMNWSAPSSGCPCYYWVYYRDTTTSSSYTSYLDKSTSGQLMYLNNGDYYEVYITATNVNPQQSPPTAPQSARSVIPPPTGVTARSNSDGTIGVSWNAPASGLYYNVYFQDTTANTPVKKFIDASTSASLTGLNLNDHYSVWITSLGNNGWESAKAGPATATSTITPPVLKVTGTTYDSINLSWTTPVPDHDVWVYYWPTSAPSEWGRFIAYVTNNNDSAQIGGLAQLQPGTSYSVKIATSQGNAMSGFSNTVTTTTSTTLPDPANLNVSTIVTDGPPPSQWDSRGMSAYADCGSVAACSVQLTWKTQPFIPSYQVSWQDINSPNGPWKTATAYPDLGSSITFTLPGPLNGFMPGHIYQVIVRSQMNGYSSSGALQLITYGDFHSQGAWATDCNMSVGQPFVNGSYVEFDWSVGCPWSSSSAGSYNSMNADYSFDGNERGFSNDRRVCAGSIDCSFSQQVPLASGSHEYCFAVMYSVIGSGLSDPNSGTYLRIDGDITNSNMCARLG
jgi:fibronectin type 3 domain-containing protein